jgi:uncharacterized protein
VEINPVAPSDRQYVQRYDVAGFRVSGQDYAGSVIVLPSRTLLWPVEHVDHITTEQLGAVLDAEPALELLVIGCGRRGVLPSPALRATLKARHIGVEAMDTGAACRTYNVLVMDGRRVAAALIKLGV